MVTAELWYTDTMTVYRTREVVSGSVDKKERVKISEGIACRLYVNSVPAESMSPTSATLQKSDKIACDPGVDIREGDEVFVTVGGKYGVTSEGKRYFAGEPRIYYEPFGGVFPNLRHMEVSLTSQERVK